MQLQLMDDQVAYLIASAEAKPEDGVLQAIATILRDNQASYTNPIDQKYREAADNEYGHEGECEIDPDAPVSRGDDPGAYVQAWVWVGYSEAGLCEKCGALKKEGDDSCAKCGQEENSDDTEDDNHIGEDGHVDYDADADHVAVLDADE